MDRLVRISFGHLKLWGLNKEDALHYLNITYGENWPNEAYLIWDHVNAKMHDKTIKQLHCMAPALHSKDPLAQQNK
ncbi:MAG: hypothetical protein OXE99_01865 [Cellvibrionales bacterium]|nr:hypothetical protein [Cellvibrionales bacterium]